MRILLSLLIALLITSCGGEKATNDGSAPSGSIAIGSKNFTEQILLGELMAQLVEAHTDLEVDRNFNLGGTMICHGALTQGELDCYAEYTGTALTAVLKQEVVNDPDEVYGIVSEAYEEQFDVVWLEPFGFNNTYAITVRRDFAEEHDLQTVADLQALDDELTAGFTAEFMEREDGYPGLQNAYGVEFGTARDMDPALMYQALAQGDVDVICAFATDGRIEKFDLVMLDDNQQFFPPYHAAPLVREETLTTHPALREPLNLLAGKLTTDVMQDLNNQIDEAKRPVAEVAHDFLVQHDLVDAAP